MMYQCAGCAAQFNVHEVDDDECKACGKLATPMNAGRREFFGYWNGSVFRDGSREYELSTVPFKDMNPDHYTDLVHLIEYQSYQEMQEIVQIAKEWAEDNAKWCVSNGVECTCYPHKILNRLNRKDESNGSTTSRSAATV
jgi:hypothetical protein